jgi:hypothetical protein
LAISERLGFLFQRAGPLTGLAASLRALGHIAEAKGYAKEAIRVALEVGNPDEVAEAQAEMAALQSGRNTPAPAGV